MKSSLTLRTRGREAGETWPITRREQKGPESTKTRRKERRRKLVGILILDTEKFFHSGIMTVNYVIFITYIYIYLFVLHPIPEIKEEEKTKDSSAEKTDSKR